MRCRAQSPGQGHGFHALRLTPPHPIAIPLSHDSDSSKSLPSSRCIFFQAPSPCHITHAPCRTGLESGGRQHTALIEVLEQRGHRLVHLHAGVAEAAVVWAGLFGPITSQDQYFANLVQAILVGLLILIVDDWNFDGHVFELQENVQRVAAFTAARSLPEWCVYRKFRWRIVRNCGSTGSRNFRVRSSQWLYVFFGNCLRRATDDSTRQISSPSLLTKDTDAN